MLSVNKDLVLCTFDALNHQIVIYPGDLIKIRLADCKIDFPAVPLSEWLTGNA